MILENISFTVSHGERIGIVGTNGCGKSTLLRLLAGEETADAGTVTMDKRTIVRMMEQNYSEDQQTLSGGERTKRNLRRILSEQANLLLLDEPTNNLDMEGVQTFLYLLEAYRGTVLMVSHDRYVLDQAVDRIIEIEHGKAVIYEGNYSRYRAEKLRRREAQMHRYEEDKKQQKQLDEAIKQVRNWSEKAHRDSTRRDPSGLKFGVKEKHRARAKRMDQQVKNNIRRLERMRKEGEERPEEEKKVKFSIQKAGKAGKRILEAEGLSKAFGDQVLFKNSDFYICRGEKVALTGPNGCGKSTFIHILEGKEEADAGSLWISPGSDPYVLPQTFTELPVKKTLSAYLEETVGQLKGLERTILHNLGITSRHLGQTIGSLSFGEQMKIKLAQPILEKRDFIILDEPTNHLDLFAREMLEDTLQDYDGTLLIVSHDQYFLQKVCNKTLQIAGQEIKRTEGH